MIIFRCSCGKQLQVNEDRAGSKVKCPECEEILRVPEAGSIREKSGPASPPPKTRPRPVEDDESFAEEERRPRGRPARFDEDEYDDRPRRRSSRYHEEDDDRANRRRREKSNKGLIIGLVVGGVVLLGAASVGLVLLLTGAQSSVETARDRTILTNNLKQITLAMHSFNDAYKRIPAPGFSKDLASRDTKPLLSWRVAILPFVEEGFLFKEFKLDEPWDGPNNIKLLNRMPKIYEPIGPQPKKEGHTYLQYVTGPGTAFPTPTSVAAIPRTFLDGTSNTILIVEAAEPVPWTKPEDFTIDVTNVLQGNVPKLGAFSPNGFHAGLGDGSVRFIERSRVSDPTIRMAFNPADGNPMPPDWFDRNR